MNCGCVFHQISFSPSLFHKHTRTPLFPRFLLGVYIKPWLIFHCRSKALQPHPRKAAPATEEILPLFSPPFVIIYRGELIDASDFHSAHSKMPDLRFGVPHLSPNNNLAANKAGCVRRQTAEEEGKTLLPFSAALPVLLFLVRCVGDEIWPTVHARHGSSNSLQTQTRTWALVRVEMRGRIVGRRTTGQTSLRAEIFPLQW